VQTLFDKYEAAQAGISFTAMSPDIIQATRQQSSEDTDSDSFKSEASLLDPSPDKDEK